MDVDLSAHEFATAVHVGMMRMTASANNKHNHASTYQRGYLERLEQEALGACGEIALCKALGYYWVPSVNTFHDVADVGRGIEVRATRRHDGRLIVRDNDPVDRWYVLVTGEPPRLTVRGCIRGHDARRNEWQRNPHGHRVAWFVPQHALRPPPAQPALTA